MADTIAVTPMITQRRLLASYLKEPMMLLGVFSGLVFGPYTAFLLSRSFLSPTIPVLASELRPVRIF
jgi:hypothetical protein